MTCARTAFAGAAAVFGSLLISSSASLADILVVASTTTSYSVGSTLPDEARVSVPEGAMLKLLKRPAGTTHDIIGPYEGTVSAYARPDRCPWYWPWCKSGTSSEGPVGGTRSVAE